MRKTIATLAGLAVLALAPAASAAEGDNFGFAQVADPDTGTVAAAFPGERAFWAGVCDLEAGADAVGSAPVDRRFPDCIEQPGGTGAFPWDLLLPPLAPGVGAGFTGPDGWTRYQGANFPLSQGTFTSSPGPSWRLADVTAAGARPDGSGSFWFSRSPSLKAGVNQTLNFAVGPDGAARDIEASLPPGVVGNPDAIPQCASEHLDTVPSSCPPNTQVGTATIHVDGTTNVNPVYNVVPRDGKTAEFVISGAGIGVLATNVPIVASLRSDGDFGVDVGAFQIPAGLVLTAQTLTIWGVPWAQSHDKFRPVASYCNPGTPASDALGNGMALTGLAGGVLKGCSQEPQSYDPSWGPIEPFLTTQTECAANPPVTSIFADDWHTRKISTATSSAPPVTDCANLSFDPGITLDPVGQGGAANQATDSASGLDVELSIPQNNDLPFDAPPTGAPQVEVEQYVTDAGAFWKSAAGLATSHLRDTVVTLPEGMTLNPAAAGGQGACTMAQIGVTDTASPLPPAIRFDKQPIACPDSSKVGEVVVETPLLEEADWPTGSVYLAAQGDNPFNSDFAIYIGVESPDRGLIVKLAGRVTPDPLTGRLTTTFAENPQLPFDTFRLSFKGGPRAPLATPVTCGTHTSVNAFAPYSDPSSPRVVNDPFDLTSSPAGGCPATAAQRPLNLGFSAGSTELVAGSHSPFTVRITRPDGNQELDRIEVTTPEGLAAKLAGVPYCPEAGIAAAIARTASGDGAKEKANPSCPAASQVGTTTIGAGAGRTPFFVKGNVYLAGPYKGAPVSLAFVVPAVAGPFDLGVQVVRTALQINPKTAQATAVSDTIPKILRGVPLRIRDVRVDIDRPGFILNPTDCAEQMVTGRVSGASGALSTVSNRFQIAECARLGFKPNLKLQLFGGTKRGAYQRLKATLTARPGDANIARTAVTLPHSEFLAQEHIRTVCTRVQFAADQCPAGSIYGKATAITPLLDQPLSGPVYLRSSDNTLPDLVAALRGPDNQPIEVELSGRTDSKNEGIRNTFDVVPDAPVSKFTLEMQGGKKSLIVNSTNICNGIHKADVRMDGQNGRKHNFTPKVTNPACGKAKKGKKAGKKGSAKKRTVAQRSLADLAGGLF